MVYDGAFIAWAFSGTFFFFILAETNKRKQSKFFSEKNAKKKG